MSARPQKITFGEMHCWRPRRPGLLPGLSLQPLDRDQRGSMAWSPATVWSTDGPLGWS